MTKILVTVKRIPDPDESLKFTGGGLDLSSVKWVPNAFDEYAVETALRLAEDVGNKKNKLAEIIVLSICPEKQRQHVTQFLAMGADRGVVVDANDADFDTAAIAKMIAKVAQDEGVDMVITGKLSQDNEGNQVGQRVAALLGWPQACFAAEVDWDQGASSLSIAREVDDGVETKKVPTPAVLTVDLRVVLPTSVRNGVNPADHKFTDGPRLASLRGITMAKRKKVKVVSPSDLGVESAGGEKTAAINKPPERAAGQIVGSVAELVEKLSSEAKVL
ncbi:electron transfer flavoprotein subunit beta/FixA family protein [Pseudenhygromyxa sp. WMMC2535]|uniref:electron transfer flavoprotein subunit beta/FixA family protein n=1 Tax=Pseudenhygromyxa sp. WMMC2535 TaxID=2712867 RepID=UPI001556659C|nr:electron transfer flavoprotein subunit beta/FixA family protein [Pseudenhygromyxa sp. WMMC2535]NVB43213.1 electron transfer flavoprotein subunit beta/FixA family protein [Pseudenhygromyxa sp. WMMC2535]